MTPLSWLSRQIYEAGANNEHFKDVRKAALMSTKAAVRRLSMRCAQESASSGASNTLRKSKKRKKSGHVYPEMRYMYRDYFLIPRGVAWVIVRKFKQICHLVPNLRSWKNLNY